jgi:hypothetical protein
MLILQFRFLFLIHRLFYQVSIATWRNACPPVRFHGPVHHVLPRHNFVLLPFPGQPRKYTAPRLPPGLQVRKSGIHQAGNGLWLAERVRKGQAITIFRRKRISEGAAKKLQKKVQKDLNGMPLIYSFDPVVRREIGTYAPTMPRACVLVLRRQATGFRTSDGLL